MNKVTIRVADIMGGSLCIAAEEGQKFFLEKSSNCLKMIKKLSITPKSIIPIRPAMMLHGIMMTRTRKMKNKAHNLTGYSFTSGERVLFDANIWLYLFPPPGNPPQTYANQYSKAVQDLLKANAVPVLTPIVLSEYLNRYCRIEWEGYYKISYQSSSVFVKVCLQ